MKHVERLDLSLWNKYQTILNITNLTPQLAGGWPVALLSIY